MGQEESCFWRKVWLLILLLMGDDVDEGEIWTAGRVGGGG